MMEQKETFTAQDRQLVIDRYTERFHAYGHSEKALGWGEKGRQALRYQVLSSRWNLAGKTVLDVGAGFGDVYRQLPELGQYVGLELLEAFVEQGKAMYGAADNFRLLQADVACLETFPVCDVAFFSGIFNFRLENGQNYAFIQSLLAKAMQCARVGVAANFITNRTDFRDPLIFYAEPEKILEIMLTMTRRYEIDQSTFPFEFSVFMHKDDAFDVSTALFARSWERRA